MGESQQRRKKLLTYAVFGAVVLAVILAAVSPGRPGSNGPTVASGDTIGLIYLEGAFSGGHSSTGAFSSSYGGDNILAFLRQAQMDPSMRAVVIRMNSPGGTVAAADEISQQIRKLRESGIKVVTSMSDVAASGAYWIAANTDKIWASPGTMTGSIGVIMELTRLDELYEKIGVQPDVIKSGRLKDIGSSSRPLTDEERALLQAMVDEMHGQFVDTIVKGRKMNPEDVKKIADGRILTGNQAKQLGLVDELGNFYDAVNDAAKIAGLRGYRIKEFGRVSPLERLLGYLDVAGTTQASGLGTNAPTGNRLLDLVWFLKDLVRMPQDVPIK